MSEKHRWERLITLMNQEKTLLTEFADTVGELRDGLHRRDWQILEEALRRMNAAVPRLNGLEQKRTTLAGRLGGNNGLELRAGEQGSDLRRRFLKARSELKSRLTAVLSRSRGIESYARSRARLGRELMEELVPAARGRMYDNKGQSAFTGRDPLVLSRHL